jgi:hypothetical protein
MPEAGHLSGWPMPETAGRRRASAGNLSRFWPGQRQVALGAAVSHREQRAAQGVHCFGMAALLLQQQPAEEVVENDVPAEGGLSASRHTVAVSSGG